MQRTSMDLSWLRYRPLYSWLSCGVILLSGILAVLVPGPSALIVVYLMFCFWVLSVVRGLGDAGRRWLTGSGAFGLVGGMLLYTLQIPGALGRNASGYLSGEVGFLVSLIAAVSYLLLWENIAFGLSHRPSKSDCHRHCYLGSYVLVLLLFAMQPIGVLVVAWMLRKRQLQEQP